MDVRKSQRDFLRIDAGASAIVVIGGHTGESGNANGAGGAFRGVKDTGGGDGVHAGSAGGMVCRGSRGDIGKGAAGSSPGHAEVGRIVLDGRGEFQRLRNSEAAAERRNGHRNIGRDTQDSDTRAGGRLRVSDGSCGECDAGRIRRIGWRGVDDGNAGCTRSAGESAAESACAGGTGKCPGYALALRIILYSGGETL